MCEQKESREGPLEASLGVSHMAREPLCEVTVSREPAASPGELGPGVEVWGQMGLRLSVLIPKSKRREGQSRARLPPSLQTGDLALFPVITHPRKEAKGPASWQGA